MECRQVREACGTGGSRNEWGRNERDRSSKERRI
jgi:hypothetical protein